MNPQATPTYDPNQLVTITNSKTKQVKRVKRADLPSYGLPIDYQSQADIFAEGVMSGTGTSLENVPQDFKGGVQAVLNENKYNQEDTKKKEAKKDTLGKAEAVLDIINKNKSGQLKGKEYDDAIASLASQYTASKAFGEGGKALTAPELAILSGQLPVIEKRTGTPIDKAIAWMQGREVPQRGVVVDSRDEVERKMILAIAALKGEDVDPEKLKAVSAKQQGGDFGGKLAANAGEDLVSILNGIANMPKTAVEGVAANINNRDKDPLNALRTILNPLGAGIAEVGKQAIPATIDEYNNALGRPMEGGDIVGRAAKHAYEKPVSTVLDVLPFLAATKLAKGKAGVSTNRPIENVPTTGGQPNAFQKMIQGATRVAADSVNSGGSKDYIARQAVNKTYPQNQVLLEEGIIGRPTDMGKIQATQQSLDKYGSQIGDAYKNSDRVFKGDELSKTLDEGLIGAGYDKKSVQFIKNYINSQGGFDLASGDNLITMEKAWTSAKTLENNPPKMLKNPESAAAYKKLSQDAARIIRGKLGDKVPQTKELNARYSALRDYKDNILPETPAPMIDIKGQGIAGSAGRTGSNILNSILQTGYDVSQPRKFIRDKRSKLGNVLFRK